MSAICVLQSAARYSTLARNASGHSFQTVLPSPNTLSACSTARACNYSTTKTPLSQLAHASACPQLKESITCEPIRPYSSKVQRPQNARALSLLSRISQIEVLSENLLNYPTDTPATDKSTQDMYLSLVDHYDSTLRDEPHPKTSLGASVLTHKATVEDNDVRINTSTVVKPRDDSEHDCIRRFQAILRDPCSNHDALYGAYRRLPTPRAPLIPLGDLRFLLSRLSATPIKSETPMLRFFAIIEDMRLSNIPLLAGEWNSAISFAGRFVAKISDEGVSRALHVWKDMEKQNGVSSTTVTFNILFDVSAKAGKLHLADLIREEMRRRSLTATRYTWVNLIQYSGFRGDSEAVRQYYRDLVSQGEIVDTVILNAMISALLDCGEPSAAEQIYYRMRSICSQRVCENWPISNWKTSRALATRLFKAAGREDLRSKIRRDYPLEFLIAPDTRTYRILIPYHCLHSGDLGKIASLIHDMQFFRIPLMEPVFLFLMKGFYQFGSTRYSMWTPEAFDDVWKAYITAVDGEKGITLSQSVVKWALSAALTIKGEASLATIWTDVHTRSNWDQAETMGVEMAFRKIQSIHRARPPLSA